MDLAGRIENLYKDIKSDNWNLVITLDHFPADSDAFTDLLDNDLDISLKKHRERRSLNANAYFYTLVNKIAVAANLSDIEVHDKLLADNLCYFTEGGVVDWVIQDWEPNKYRLVRHNNEYYYDSLQVVRLTKDDGTPFKANGQDKISKIFWHVKGSHQMDTKEMSRLIDATVQEAKGLGIETMTPEQLEQLKTAWKGE